MDEAEGLLSAAEELLARRKVEDALRAFDVADPFGPDRCSGGRWMGAMLQGDFERAWRESDALRRRNAADPHRLWDGRSLHGKRVIVRCLHGLGDTVQMLRYAPLLSARAKSLVFEVPPRFVEIAACFTGVDAVITWDKDAPQEEPPWEIQVEVMELPYLFRTTCNDLPQATRYLTLPAVEMERVQKHMGDRRGWRIGVVWAAGEWNMERSIPLPLLKPLLVLEGIEFWSLQGGTQAREAEASGLKDANAVCGEGMMALAATIANLDLVLTVDTLAAHLAGAMGKQVWVMLPFAADWRWMMNRQDSPWYPTMRLFRQSESGSWEGVINAVRAAMREEWP